MSTFTSQLRDNDNKQLSVISSLCWDNLNTDLFFLGRGGNYYYYYNFLRLRLHLKWHATVGRGSRRPLLHGHGRPFIVRLWGVKDESSWDFLLFGCTRFQIVYLKYSRRIHTTVKGIGRILFWSEVEFMHSDGVWRNRRSSANALLWCLKTSKSDTCRIFSGHTDGVYETVTIVWCGRIQIKGTMWSGKQLKDTFYNTPCF